VLHIKGDKGDFSDYSFKEGNTAVVKLQDIFLQEKGPSALKKLQETETHGSAKVAGGAKRKGKAAHKKAHKAGKKSTDAAGEVRKSVDKVLKYTPSKSAAKKDTPQKHAGKVSAKKSVSKRTPSMPSPGGKKSKRTTDQMSMTQFKKYLEYQEKKKGGKSSSKGKVLGKRSAGKASASSGKKSGPKGKKSAK